MNRPIIVVALLTAACAPQWPTGSRGRSNLCELAQPLDAFVIASVVHVHDPATETVDGESFWATRVDWAGEAKLSSRSASYPPVSGTTFSTRFAGPFAHSGRVVFGRVSGTDWVDLNADATYRESDGGVWRRGGHARGFETGELGAAMDLAFAATDCSVFSVDGGE